MVTCQVAMYRTIIQPKDHIALNRTQPTLHLPQGLSNLYMAAVHNSENMFTLTQVTNRYKIQRIYER